MKVFLGHTKNKSLFYFDDKTAYQEQINNYIEKIKILYEQHKRKEKKHKKAKGRGSIN